ncbi:unnamed protein product [Kuraishia capsulata CBS 1993]|uniref:Letm1 RBD domain-containing protein n=1 Tax=Kuraishia capsulata CBS 1993 TaxID=1382522 RepID=W6MG06_9ASCO|nr:uncharacterized protein KUCA_T00000319001 [Kuraishia capsulata CBS 1993]CDK24358.1 unnamed protein product [Kuraishia capsulata CBS 1993]
MLGVNTGRHQSLLGLRLASTESGPKTESTKKPVEAIQKASETAPKVPETAVVKQPLWDRVKHEAQHYWDGTKLLGYEVKVSSKLLLKMAAGYELTRRETTQLTRTITDIMRLIPFSMFVLIPFAELLLPVALKLFPNMLPSTYESKSDKKKKTKTLIKTRQVTSEFIQRTVQESGLNLPKNATESEKTNFVEFFRLVRNGEKPTHEQLIRIARYFKNDQVLDNLSRPQLVAMAKYMNLTPFGTDEMLRYQIRYKLLQVMKDDRAIDYEGVESLSIQELQSACASRGIKTFGASPARLRDDLNIWLDLRLRQKIPSTLLILSSTFTYGEHADDMESYYDALFAVLSSIPDEVYNMAKLELANEDSKLKLNILKEQDMLIKEEEQQNRKITESGRYLVKDDIKLSDYEEQEQEQEQQQDKSQDKSQEEQPNQEQVKENEAESVAAEIEAPQKEIRDGLEKSDSKSVEQEQKERAKA